MKCLDCRWTSIEIDTYYPQYYCQNGKWSCDIDELEKFGETNVFEDCEELEV